MQSSETNQTSRQHYSLNPSTVHTGDSILLINHRPVDTSTDEINYNNLNDDEKEIYDAIKAILPKDFERVFDILYHQRLTEKTLLVQLTEDRLEKIGITKMGVRMKLINLFEKWIPQPSARASIY